MDAGSRGFVGGGRDGENLVVQLSGLRGRDGSVPADA
jgi:hypothetical protein